MSRRKKDPLRTLSGDERVEMERLSRSGRESATVVAHAKALLAVAKGAGYTHAATVVGRRSGDAVAHLVARFNREGLEALYPRHSGGPAARYTSVERERILTEARRKPEHEGDGTATWSLTTLQRALRRAADGLPQVSTYTIWWVLTDAGWSWQRTRTWRPTGTAGTTGTTGTAVRLRKRGRVHITDRDAEAKRG
jgi:transposase